MVTSVSLASKIMPFSLSTKKILLIVMALAIVIGLWRWRASGAGDEESGDEVGETEARTGSSDGNQTSMVDRLRDKLGVAQDPTAPRSGELAGRGLARGVVLDADSGERRAGVDVLFRRGGGEETVTSGEDGSFQLELFAGLYEVRAIGDRLISGAQPDVRVLPGDNSLQIEVRVRRLATLSGKVVDFAGRGVRGATVHFVPTTPAEKAMAKGGLILDQVPTEAGGEFELDVVAADKLIIEARRGFLRRALALEKIAPGEVRSGLVIELQRGAEVSGVVVGPSGAPVAGAQVSLQVAERDRKVGQMMTSDRDGRFAFEPMEPGSLVLEARAVGFAASAPHRAVFEAGHEASVTLSLLESQTLAGRVLDADGEPVGGTRIRVGRGGSKMKATEVYSDDDGRFAVPDLDRGKHWISAKKGGYSIATQEKVRPPRDDLELVVLPFGSIAGRVTSATGQPFDDFVVEIMTIATTGVSRPRPSGLATRFRDKNGVYRLDDLDPGRYQIQVRAGSRAPVSLNLTVPPGGVARGDAVMPP